MNRGLRMAVAAALLAGAPAGAEPTRVGNGWDFTHDWPGDWTGDGKLDMLVRTSSGDMLPVPRRNGSFS